MSNGLEWSRLVAVSCFLHYFFTRHGVGPPEVHGGKGGAPVGGITFNPFNGFPPPLSATVCSVCVVFSSSPFSVRPVGGRMWGYGYPDKETLDAWSGNSGCCTDGGRLGSGSGSSTGSSSVGSSSVGSSSVGSSCCSSSDLLFR